LLLVGVVLLNLFSFELLRSCQCSEARKFSGALLPYRASEISNSERLRARTLAIVQTYTYDTSTAHDHRVAGI
jgi:hypothetical protein